MSLVADTRLYTLPCRSVGRSVRPKHFWIPSGFCITAPAQPSATGLPCIRPCFSPFHQQQHVMPLLRLRPAQELWTDSAFVPQNRWRSANAKILDGRRREWRRRMNWYDWTGNEWRRRRMNEGGDEWMAEEMNNSRMTHPIWMALRADWWMA